MTNDIESIDWAVHRDAYGSAAALPKLFAALVSPVSEDRHDALEQLTARIYHQDRLEDVAPLAVPFLIEALGAEHAEPAGVLRFLRALAYGGSEDLLGSPPILDYGPVSATPEDRARYHALALEVYRAVSAGRAVYARLLAHEDPRTRAAAAFVLASLRDEPEASRAALEAALATERDTNARASELVALGVIDRALGASIDTAALSDLATSDPFLRGAAAVALTYACSSPDEARFEALAEAAALQPVAPERFPWHQGALAGLAAEALALLASNDRRRAVRALTAALSTRLARGDGVPVDSSMPEIDVEALLARSVPVALEDLAASHVEARDASAVAPPMENEDDAVHAYAALETTSAVAERLLQLTFAPFAGRRDDELLWEELSEEQREVVRALGDHSLETSARSFGLLVIGKDRARFAGLLPQGPLDEALLVGRDPPRPAGGLLVGDVALSWPVWKWLRAFERGAVDAPTLSRALLAGRTPNQVVALCGDVLGGAYAARGRYDDSVVELLFGVAESSLPDAAAALEAYASTSLLPDPDAQPVACAFFVRLMAAHCRAAGRTLAPEYDKIVATAVDATPSVRELANEVLPPERRI